MDVMRALRRRVVLLGALAAAMASAAPPAWSQDRFIVMASTTSTEQSGLFGHLLPLFKQATGVDVRVVAVGTGQALDMARRGDADVVFVHDTAAEEKFVAEGFSVKRWPVMYNDFVVVGPASDPAKIKGNDIAAALARLNASAAPFISRGDKSGTDAAERRLWAQTGLGEGGQPLSNDKKGTGYKECGCGMGPALNMGSSSNAYVLSDRGTWLSFKNRGDLAILVEGDKRLFNQYGVIVVNPARFPHVKADLAQSFSDWITSEKGQAVIAAYRINGEQLFFPNAN